MKLVKNTFFKFFFFYFLFSIAPWMLFSNIPGVNYLTEFYTKGFQGLVFKFNDWFLHVREKLNIEGYGSGDTSYAWAEFYTILILSILLAVILTVFDKKKKIAPNFSYWLLTLIRYYIAGIAFSYGFIKLFALQMPFPSLSQLATPLGDFLPMRLCWMHMGYSVPYQTFSGIMEIIVGLLLVYRRTVPVGLIMGLGVFINVFALNLSYDIPVKLFSMQIVIACLFLLAWDWKHYLNFFILNKTTQPITSFNFNYTKKWQRIGRYILKSLFIILSVGLSFYEAWGWYQEDHADEKCPIRQGVYTIQTVTKNNSSVPLISNDTIAWKDFIFDKNGKGSINTRDTIFNIKYGRGYFNYTTDEKKQTILFKKLPTDSTDLFVMQYKVIDNKTIELKGKVKNDTLFYRLEKSNRTFPLAECQFHWISESNR